jgi:CelD/BcsL family acetyltransferase involved in cellulose biosynthesis
MLFLEAMAADPLCITLTVPPDLDGVRARWRALETIAEGSFFQSWTWVGCLAESRFPRPVLLAVQLSGRTLGLALLNRTGPFWKAERLFLGESGDPALDAVYVEHNGLLLATEVAHFLPTCLDKLLGGRISPERRRLGRRLRLPGVNDAHLAAARALGTIRLLHSSPAPFVDMSALPRDEQGFLESLSPNTRYQLRRSIRRYAPAGLLSVCRAESLEEALTFLEALASLHQATWNSRGKPGAFANPFFMRFHLALLANGFPRGEVDLLRISAGSRLIGYLYNFVYRGRVLSYQSGFDYAAAETHQKPGLTCHAAAISFYREQGAKAYDFLAGGDRYKTSLANANTNLHWLDVVPRLSARGLLYAIGNARNPRGVRN